MLPPVALFSLNKSILGLISIVFGSGLNNVARRLRYKNLKAIGYRSLNLETIFPEALEKTLDFPDLGLVAEDLSECELCLFDNQSREISKLAHVDLFSQFNQCGDSDPRRYASSRYFRFHALLGSLKGARRDRNWILAKIEVALSLFSSIRDKGLLESRVEHLPIVKAIGIEKSLSRFDSSKGDTFFELQDGHHRLAAAYVLGIKQMVCLVVK
jgi:hypothetical protein